MKKWILLCMVLMYFVQVSLAPGAVLNVPADYLTIQSAINEASEGDTVLVAAGTYVENIILKNGVAVIGDGASVTKIDGGGIGSVVSSSSCGSDTLLEGFTITNGQAKYGGGMYNYNSGPTVTSCTFSGNSASVSGGGMFNGNINPLIDSPTVTNCTFSGNQAGEGGGGMYNLSSSPIVTNCTFSGNSAQGGGGMINASGSPTVTNCTFSGNSALFGGGMFNLEGSPIVTGCTFSGNTADFEGGGMYNNSMMPMSVTTVTNCTFSGNSANYGGGMYNNSMAPMSVTTVTNCILWGNSATTGPEIYSGGGVITVTYSDVAAGYTGTGNINADPLFAGAPADLHLLPGSPCIDAGDNDAVPLDVTTDLDGNPRFIDDPDTTDTGSGTPPIVDMGAYEFVPPIEVDIDIDPNTLNLQSNGRWLSCHIWLPEQYDVTDVNSNSVLLEYDSYQIGPEWIWFSEANQAVMAKFNSSQVKDILLPDQDVVLTIIGKLMDGTSFEGIGTIRVIDQGVNAR